MLLISTMSDFSASNLFCCEDADDVAAEWPQPTDEKVIDLPPESNERWIATILESEPHHMPSPDYIRRFRDRSLDVTSRQDAVNWILKVHSYYRFRPGTAYLSINYFDRFLSANSLPRGNGWPLQLLSVACLSLAAKMEETCVPLLLDFQLFEPRFVFESRTVRRMELLVMASLKWRMRAVTPFDFVDCFVRETSAADFHRLFARASELILNTHRVIDFLEYRPSTVAAAAVLSAAREIADISSPFDPNTAVLPYLLNQEMVSRCQLLMEEYLIDTCPFAGIKTEPEPAPNSPVGVLDAAACASCDTQKSSFAVLDVSRAQPSHTTSSGL